MAYDDNPDNPNPPPTGPTPPSGGGFYSLAYVLPDGTKVYQDSKGNLFTNTDPKGNTGQWTPYTATPPTTPPISTPPGDVTPKDGTTPKPPPPGPGVPPSTEFPPFGIPAPSPTNNPLPPAPGFNPPNFTAPPPFSFADFVNTTADDMNQDPGFQVRVDRGRDILEHGAAAKGILNTGMTLKDILDYGQNSASQEFQNVDNRRRSTYSMNRSNAVGNYEENYKTQYYDPYTFQYKSAYDAANLAQDAWKTNAGFTERANEFNTTNDMSKWWDQYQMFLNEQRDRWGRAKDVLTA